MSWVLFGLLIVVIGVAAVAISSAVGRRDRRRLADAREDALRWYERLGGQIMNLTPAGGVGSAVGGAAGEVGGGGGDGGHDNGLAVRQALVDAGERYNAAGSQLERSTTVRQYELVRETALEGLAYVRAARVALGLDPGPDLPPLASQRVAGAITKDREVEVQGQQYRASGHPGDATPYYYPGGMVSGRPVPAGWYSDPWWKTALIGGAWGIGAALVFDSLLDSSWGDPGHHDVSAFTDGGDSGFDAGGGSDGGDSGFDAGGGSDGGSGFDGGGFDGGGFDAGGFDGGGFDGGGFDGGGGF